MVRSSPTHDGLMAPSQSYLDGYICANLSLKQYWKSGGYALDDSLLAQFIGNHYMFFISDLGNNEVGDKGCLSICKAHWPKMIWLTVGENKIDQNGLITLITKNSSGIKHLKSHFSFVSVQLRKQSCPS